MQSGNSDSKVRVAYIDDQLLFREALANTLDDSGSVGVIRSASHGAGDFRTLLDTPVSVALVSLDGQQNDPMLTLRELHRVVPELPVCALVSADRLERVRDALGAGCKGAVSTSATLSMLIAALENLARGQAFVDPTLGGRLLAKSISRPMNQKINGNGSASNPIITDVSQARKI